MLILKLKRRKIIMNYITKKNLSQNVNIKYVFTKHKLIIRSFLLKYFTEDEIK
jgi:hypothetical protein